MVYMSCGFLIECIDSLYSGHVRLSRVLIFYASADLDKMTREGRLVLKAGWNFLARAGNPDWLHGNMPSGVIHKITQDINDFKRQGFRWHIQMPLGGN